jgi:hypothetical protein
MGGGTTEKCLVTKISGPTCITVPATRAALPHDKLPIDGRVAAGGRPPPPRSRIGCSSLVPRPCIGPASVKETVFGLCTIALLVQEGAAVPLTND